MGHKTKQHPFLTSLNSPPCTRNYCTIEMLDESKTKSKTPISDLTPSLKPSSKSLNKNDAMYPLHFTTATMCYFFNKKSVFLHLNVLQCSKSLKSWSIQVAELTYWHQNKCTKNMEQSTNWISSWRTIWNYRQEEGIKKRDSRSFKLNLSKKGYLLL